MIAKLMSSLSDNGKKLFAVAMIIVIIALFDRLLIGPTMSRMQTIDQDIAQEESSIKQSMHFLGYKDKILKESQALSLYITQDLPKEEEIIAGFLKRLEILAGKANVSVSKVTPSTGTQTTEYWKYAADLECTGKLKEVVSFMHLIDTSNDLMKVSKYSLSSKKDSDDIKASLTVDKTVIGKRPMPAPAPAGEGGDTAKTSGASAASTSKP